MPVALTRAEELGYDPVIIDTPPTIMDIIEQAIEVADLVVIPNQPSATDLAGNEAAVDLVTEAEKDFVFVVNRTAGRRSFTKDDGNSQINGRDNSSGAQQSDAVSHQLGRGQVRRRVGCQSSR